MKAKPKIHPTAYIDKNAVIYGDVEIGEDSSIWPFASIRCEANKIRIGKRTSIQESCSLHIDPGHDVIVGDNVTIGHNAVIHGATIGNNCVIGIGAIVLDGVVIGDNCFIAAGSVVTPNAKIPKNSMVMGVPGKVVREVTKNELEYMKKDCDWYVEIKDKYMKKK